MELIRKNIHMDRIKNKAVTQITLEEDVNVSDNKPDVAMIVSEQGKIKLEEMKVTQDHVNVKGKLHFSVLYLGEEGMQKVFCLEGAIPFEEAVYMEGVQNTDAVQIKWDLEDITVESINSRKLSVQALLTLTLCVEELYDEEIVADLHCEEPVEICKKSLELAQMTIQKKDIYRLKEEIELPSNLPNIFAMIWKQLQIGVIDFRPLNDKISVQGDLQGFFLYEGEGEEQPVRWYETTIPFSGVLECSGCNEMMIPDIEYMISHIEIEVRPDFDGEERMIGIDMALDMDMKLYQEEKVEVLSDVYGVTKEIDAVTKEGNCKSLLIRNIGKTKIAERIKVPSGNMGILQLCNGQGEVKVDQVNIVENALEVHGTVAVKILYITDDDKLPFAVMRETIPFLYTLEVPGIHAKCSVKVTACVEQMVIGMIDSEEVDVKIVLSISAIVFCNRQEKMTSDVRIAELDIQKLGNLPSISVYIAKKGDTLWDVGKKYYVPIAQIKEANGFTGELQAGDKLLVVK